MHTAKARSTMLAFGALLGCAGTLFAQATPQIDLWLGALATEVSGERDAKFQQYRDLSEGPTIDLDAALWGAEAWSLNLVARNAARDDESYRLTMDRAGRLRGAFTWDGIPHLMATNATLLHSFASGRFVLAPAVRAALENDPTLAPSVLAQAGRSFAVKTQRDVADLRLRYRFSPSWRFDLGARQLEKKGNQRTSVGTYIRRQVVGANSGPGFFDRERFEPRGLELPAPVDSKTEELAFGVDFDRGRLFANAGWEASDYDNDATTLFWENPFEAPPGLSSSGTGIDGRFDQEPPAPVGNTANRGRFAQAALDLWPSNDYQRFHVAGGLDLPARTRLHLGWAQAEVEQDDPFLPYTLNEAVLFSVGPDGKAGTPDDLLAKDAPLPARSLDGSAETTRLDLRLTSRPLPALSLRASYRSYEYDDQRPSIQWPGYAAAGDSYMRRGIGQRDAAGNRVLFNEIGGYERTAWSAGGAWKFGPTATVDVDYTHTEWEYETRQVEATDEDAFGGKLHLRLGDRLVARLSYLDAARDFTGDYEIGLETSRLRAFDVWTRDRARVAAEVEFEAGERWVMGLSWHDGEDEYPGVIELATLPASNPFPSQPYGLNRAETSSLAAQATFHAEGVRINLAAGEETSDWQSLAVVKTTLASDTVQFDPQNRWVRNQDDEVFWATAGLEADLIPEKLDLTADLSWYDYAGDFETSNPATPNVNSGVAYDSPAFSSELLTVRLRLDWTVLAGVGLFLGYWHEPYRLDDFMWDAVRPWIQGVVKETAGAPDQLRDAAVGRWLFLDSRYSDYTANVFSIGIRYRR